MEKTILELENKISKLEKENAKLMEAVKYLLPKKPWCKGATVISYRLETLEDIERKYKI